MGEEKSLKLVKRKLKIITTELAAVSTFSTSFDPSIGDINEIRVRLESLLVIVDRFELLQTELEDLEDHVPDEQRMSERIAFKDFFFSVKASLMKLMDAKQKDHSSSLSCSEITNENRAKCIICNTEHFLFQCMKFKQLTVEERRDLVFKNRLCFNCLRADHQVRHCKSSSCTQCDKRHNTLLHLNYVEQVADDQHVNKNQPNQEAGSAPPNVVGCNIVNSSIHCRSTIQVILATAIVHVYDATGNVMRCRAVLDSGSQLCFVSSKMARRLGLQITNNTVPISGIGQSESATSKSYSYINDEQPDSVPHVIAPVMSSSPHACVTTVSTITISHQLNPNTECGLGTLETGPVQPILKDARNVFNGLEALYVHFSKPANDHKLSTIQNKLGLKITKIEKLSDTRWVCRYKSCNALIQNYNSVLITLDNEILEQKSKDVAQAIGVRATISNFKFILYLFILHEVLQSINILSTQLQLKGTTLGRSGNLVKGIISTLENNRNGEHFSELWDNIKTFCLEHNISINIPVQGLKRPIKEPTYLSEYDVTVSTAAEQTNNCLSDNDSNQKQYWKLNAFYVIMDSIICSMKTRFSEESLSIATSADKLMQFDYEGSSFLVEHYKWVSNHKKKKKRPDIFNYALAKNVFALCVDMANRRKVKTTGTLVARCRLQRKDEG
ncbi:hypothetical protein ACI65C_006049 [Semiaphis heraclei]